MLLIFWVIEAGTIQVSIDLQIWDQVAALIA